MESVPIVIAFNKRDLPDVLSVEELDRELNPFGFPSLATSAATGKGVFESLDAVVRLALDDLRQRRVIPSDVEVPADGIIMERLSEVRAPTPSAMVEPMRIVSEEPPRSPSMTMPAIMSTDARATPSTPMSAMNAPRVSPASAASGGAVPRSTASDSVGNAALAASMAYGSTLTPNAVPALRNEPAAAPNGDSANDRRATASAMATAVTQAPTREDNTPKTAGSSAALRRASMFAPLFPSEDQDTLRNLEEALGESILPRAALLLEALLVRVLERSARSLGREGAAHESIAWVLQIPQERYGRLRTLAQRARRGGEISRRDVLEGYLVVALAQSASDQLVGR
jgi:hypothetical protein